jgi:hypothetical protein
MKVYLFLKMNLYFSNLYEFYGLHVCMLVEIKVSVFVESTSQKLMMKKLLI